VGNNAPLYIVICLVLPTALLCLYLEKRARRVIISMIFGVVAGFAAAYVNTAFKNLGIFGNTFLRVCEGPVIEELLKFIPVLAVSVITKKGRRGSIANAFSVGVGFCVVENISYLISSLETADFFWIVSRSIGTGLMHSMTTTIAGIGIYEARTKGKLKVLRGAAALAIGIAFHSLFNLLVGWNQTRIIAILLPIAVYFSIYIVAKKENLHHFLYDEKDGGSLSDK